jgi:hypothetical protein
MSDSSYSFSGNKYEEEVWYEEGGKVKIQVSESYVYDLDISEDGELSFQDGESIGSFSDKNNLKISFSHGGNGGGGSENVIGSKK